MICHCKIQQFFQMNQRVEHNYELQTTNYELSFRSNARTWVEIDRAALRHNIGVAKKRVPHAGIIAVLKANAYGHGMEEVTKTLAPHVAAFAVASCEEALRLQQAVSIFRSCS